MSSEGISESGELGGYFLGKEMPQQELFEWYHSIKKQATGNNDCT